MASRAAFMHSDMKGGRCAAKWKVCLQGRGGRGAGQRQVKTLGCGRNAASDGAAPCKALRYHRQLSRGVYNPEIVPLVQE